MPVTTFQNALNLAAELQHILGCPDWLNFVGVGEADGRPCIYLYTKRKKFSRDEIPDTWHNIPVKVKYIGRIRTATT